MDAFTPAWRLAELARSGEVSCLELLDAALDRAERLNPCLNAIILTDPERARTRARLLDAGNRRDGGPLFGVPMTVKESFDFAGHPTTWGHAARHAHRAEFDALAVQRLEAAGAVVFGKTNIPVALADWQSYNPIYGSSNNPWNPAHTPGGSSGGAAAAVAAGLSALELGSDIGGSIRVPAHFCGVFGHKPSWNICSARGHSVSEPGGPVDIAVIGPLGRSARDVHLAFDAILGPDPDHTEMRITLPPSRVNSVRDLRVAVWTHQDGLPTDPEISAAVESAGIALQKAGASVSFDARPEFDAREAYHIFLALLDAALSGRMPESVLEWRRQAKAALTDGMQTADAVMTRAVDMPHRQFLLLDHRRYRFRYAWHAFFENWDVLLCPAFATTALPHMQEDATWQRTIQIDGVTIAYNDLLFWPGITGGFHLPATVAPMGLSSDGLPIGVQIAGPHGGDYTTLAVARMMEEIVGGFEAPPNFA